MKMNPPARSSRPTSRKNPRIMRHLNICRPQRLSANTGGTPEIQPHQHLTRYFSAPFPVFQGGRKALTVQDQPSIRPPMAAGRRCSLSRAAFGSILASDPGILKNGLRQNTLEKTTSDHAI